MKSSIDLQMKNQNPKVVLILDRCPAHVQIIGLTYVKLYFLPPNTTSRTQPLDAGTINAMKCQYRKRILQRMLLCYENKLDFNFTLLDALNVIKVDWDKVSKETVLNCFRHCLASDSLYEPTEQKDFGNIVDKLLLFIQVPKEVSFSNFIDVEYQR